MLHHVVLYLKFFLQLRFFLYNCHICLQEGNINVIYNCAAPTINEWARIPPIGVNDPISFNDEDHPLSYTLPQPAL